MPDLQSYLARLETLFRKRGYRADTSGIEKAFAWKPDLLLAHGNETHAFLLRQTGTLPSPIVERLTASRSKKRDLFINVVFLSQPLRDTKKTLSLHGLGIQHLDRNKLLRIADSKNFRPSKKNERRVPARKKMSKTEIFVSSQQNIPERTDACKTIDDIQTRDRFPVYSFKVEDDPRFGGSRAQTKKCIDEGLQRCDWFLAILSDNQRYWVNYEVRQAVKRRFAAKDITIYVKSTKMAESSWKGLLDWIKKEEVKYLPYTDLDDLRSKLSRRMLQKIEEVHKKLHIPMYS